MVVQVVHTPSATYEVSGSGYVPEAVSNRQTVQLLNPKQTELRFACLHQKAMLVRASKSVDIIGDPTEGAPDPGW